VIDLFVFVLWIAMLAYLLWVLPYWVTLVWMGLLSIVFLFLALAPRSKR
jgi:hypothetical protein